MSVVTSSLTGLAGTSAGSIGQAANGLGGHVQPLWNCQSVVAT